MRIIDLALDATEVDELAERVANCGHRLVRIGADGDLVLARIVVQRGDPDAFLEDLRARLREDDAADRTGASDADDSDGSRVTPIDARHYAVVEALAIEPARECEDDAEEDANVAGTDEIESFVGDGARIDGTFVLLSAIAGAMAAGGLLLDSPAILVGAMVVAPLLKPIGVIGVGVFLGRLRSASMGVIALAVSLTLAIACGAVIAMLTPGGVVTDSLLARSAISPFDLLIATCAGAALSIALRRRDAMTLVGIVVAASVVPVAAAAGVALAFIRIDLAAGALYTLVSNLCGVMLGLSIGLRLAEFRGPGRLERSRGERWGMRVIVGSLVIGALLLGIGAWESLTVRSDPMPPDPRVAVVVETLDDGVLIAEPIDDAQATDVRYRLRRVDVETWRRARAAIEASDEIADDGSDSTRSNPDADERPNT